jgi:hypothetical protein
MKGRLFRHKYTSFPANHQIITGEKTAGKEKMHPKTIAPGAFTEPIFFGFIID